jgi:hypothetical protein
VNIEGGIEIFNLLFETVLGALEAGNQVERLSGRGRLRDNFLRVLEAVVNGVQFTLKGEHNVELLLETSRSI